MAALAYYNEIDLFAAQWLRNLIDAGHIAPGIVDTRSIEDVTPNDLKGFTQCHFFAGIGVWSYALRLVGWPDDKPIWTGSCPCQPFSPAGKGNGFADERHLWPAFHWLIGQCRPVIVAGEQSGSADANVWIDLVQTDMESLGYAFGAVAFPSAGVGAPHIRDRAYWVADTSGERIFTQRFGEAASPQAGTGEEEREQRFWLNLGAGSGVTGGVANTCREGLQGWVFGWEDAQREAINGHAGCDGTDRGCGPVNGFWRSADWLHCRDGNWRPVKPGLKPLVDGVAGRVGKIRAYGNAVNAYAAAAFLSAYLQSVA
ncbi:DNA cytosine methyltransferase [Citrobacter sp. FP75]|uniref:DNA cytosine methyltransferase n=1 Tax=Citrobacter sp. FP75 TaxID=1852949 RepID=UPI001BC9550B|nr:DNA cytosine methyltransferase [Citrobacter sp. FP75]